MIASFTASAADLAHRTTAWLATQPGDYDPSTGKGPDWGKAAPIGLLIILLLGVALFFLIRSMNKNLRRVPASFDAPSDQPDAGPSRDTTDDISTGEAATPDVRTDTRADAAAPPVPAPDDSRPPH